VPTSCEHVSAKEIAKWVCCLLELTLYIVTYQPARAVRVSRPSTFERIPAHRSRQATELAIKMLINF
jgi:hypothetical protein